MKTGNILKSDNWKHFKKILLHVLIWLGIFVINFLLFRKFSVHVDSKYYYFTWFIYLVLFYTNYLVLMPALFFKKKFFLYAFFSLVLLSCSFFSRDFLFENYDSDIRDRIRIEKSFKESINVNQNVPDISSEKFRRQPEPVVISYVLLIFITSFAVKLFIQFRKNEKKIDEALKTKIVTEQNFLKQQVNPHFLFNSLNSIYSLANRKSVKTSEAVVKLSDILRYMIYDSQQDKVLLAREINNIRSFIEFQKLRLTGKTKIKFIVDFNPENDLEIEPLLLISMVENAFKYGADNFTESFINLNIKVKDRILYFKVKNRIVHEPQDKGEISGIGLKNVKKRLESLYAGKYELNIIKDEHIFNLSLKLNLEKNNFIWR